MKKPLLSVCFLLLLHFFVRAQAMPQGNWQLVDADVLGFVYLSDGVQLIKTDLKGNQVANYQDSYLGDIQQIDCFKGLKNLVFHKDANAIVLLDNELAPLGDPLDLSTKGFYDVSATCLGPDDQIWIADGQTGQLLLISKNLEVLQKGAVYFNYANAVEIEKMVWRNNMLLVLTRSDELLLFDQFGTFSHKFSFNRIEKPYVNYKHVYYVDKQRVLKFNYTINKTDTLFKGNKPIDAVWQSKNQLYLLEENQIEPLNY
ncbi:MAG TPA: hypothetical protein VJ937_03390 [Salinivirga sp.]|uniref:hypothetical protein n=1 Tax=Salinivirga sp. TaxID=1970192 RepID=UPI002B464BE6|nr:hypothetical protein [Salinivirga sp.]HKK58494.1 hypothetical protein [Salinivirga sp.]